MLHNRLHINTFIIISLLFFFTTDDAPATELDRETPVVKTVRSVSPAVVNISSEYEVRRRGSPFSGFGIDPFFDSFFRDFFDPGFEQKYKRTSLGSGVIIDGKRGLILTNEHVIAKSSKITVVLRDQREFKAQIVGADPDSDLAVLRIDADKPLPSIEMGNSDGLMIGETIVAIGNPFGFSHTVTTGVISALNRSIRTDDRVFHNFIQTDASINPGNSGGPLLNINGKLIGINTAIYAKAQGIGFAIPINKAKRIVSDLIKYGEVIQAWIGIVAQDLDAKVAGYLKLNRKKGVIVQEIENDSPAETAGVREGDVILGVGSQSIFSKDDYYTFIKDYAAGDRINLGLWRNAERINLAVKTSVFPLERALDLAYKLLGVRVENLTRQNRHHYDIVADKGVLISQIDKRSYLARIGVVSGDVIRQMDDFTIQNIADFKKALVKYRKKASVVVLLQRGDQGYYITVKL
ncbi:Do family serine endopeptidase [Thermodesulfobacteriota bacterium]